MIIPILEFIVNSVKMMLKFLLTLLQHPFVQSLGIFIFVFFVTKPFILNYLAAIIAAASAFGRIGVMVKIGI